MGTLKLSGVAVGTLENIDLEVAPGEIVCLSGPSGGGKSRLLRAIADLDPHGGQVTLDDINQSALPAHLWRGKVMMVPAESAWWHDTVGEHFPQSVGNTLAQIGLDPGASTWPVTRLSSGEKQRLALVRALSYEPSALLLDEPTANLDRDSTAKVEAWLCERIRADKLPTIWVAHHEDQIARVANRHVHITGAGIEALEVAG
ncbi:ATP-binding cassette domain-containing protein [Microbulbifer aggregans]|uniref:ABC transporter ATP-binding protein n=1 Tax=Microbulbifer aggregans TaxID=1769779 RepID=UPI001CFE5B1C|nr:ATP-binding cassette domain-containing protein [Microbulbifer aggregans]